MCVFCVFTFLLGTPPQGSPPRVRRALGVGKRPLSRSPFFRPCRGRAEAAGDDVPHADGAAGLREDGGRRSPPLVAPGPDGGWDDVDANEALAVNEGSSGVVYLLTVWDTACNPAADPRIQQLSVYIVSQLERAPTTGQEHFQTLIVTKDKIKFRTLQRKLVDIYERPPFIKPVRLSTLNYDRARAYCMKEETRVGMPVEWGKWPFQKEHKKGSRTDIHGALEWAVANPDACDPIQWIDAGFGEEWVKYPRLRLVQSAPLATRELPPPTLYWFCGGPGTGKSKRASMLAKKLAEKNMWRVYYRKDHSVPLWPNYTSQEIVVWEEFREVLEHQSLGAMCSMWDRGAPLPTNEKWGGSHMVARVHIVTCPNRPEDTFPMSMNRAHGQIGQLLRRVTRCVELKNVLPVAVDVVDVAAECFEEVMAEEPDV